MQMFKNLCLDIKVRLNKDIILQRNQVYVFIFYGSHHLIGDESLCMML